MGESPPKQFSGLQEGPGKAEAVGSGRSNGIATPRISVEGLWNPEELQNPVFSRARSGSSNWPVRKAMPENEETRMEGPAFDPAMLMNEGLDEWQSRNINLAHIKRGRSFNVRNSIDEGREAADGALKPTNLVSPKRDYSLELANEYYDSLVAAPHAALIHLVILYHQALWKNGHLSEADSIASSLAALRDPDKAAEAELMGMDLLLKDGLLQYLLRISPHLPPVPAQIVKFKGITYIRDLVPQDVAYETMYTKVVGCLSGPFRRRQPAETVHLLKDVTGYLMPGTMTLVIGPPGCGMSVLTRMIAGRPPLPGARFQGSITYNHKDVRSILYQRYAAAIENRDIHLAALSVRETLEFARDVSLEWGPKNYPQELQDLLTEAIQAGQDPKLEVNLSMLGLKRIADRPVMQLKGDERHRLTAAEVMAGAYPVYLFDQLNAGLDDSVTNNIVSSLRIYTRIRQFTVMASLRQPSSEVYDLFDRVMLMDKGRVVFQGPREDVLPYFEKLGYVKPVHLSIGEFLSEVTTDDGIEYLQKGFPRLSLDDFVAAYLASDTYRDVCRVVDSNELHQQVWVQGSQPVGVTFVDGQGDPASTKSDSNVVAAVSETGSFYETSMDQTARVQPGDEVVAFGGLSETLTYLKTDSSEQMSAVGLERAIGGIKGPVRVQLQRPLTEADVPFKRQFSEEYVLTFGTEFKKLLLRELKVTWRNKFSIFLRFFQVLVMSLFTGLLFFRVKLKPKQLNLNLLRGSYFVSLLNMTLINLGQLPVLMEERPIYYKQQGQHFYRPSTFLLAKIFGSMPFSIAEATIWSIIVYFLTGQTVSDNGWHFWVYYLILVLTVINGASLVRFVSFLAPNRDKANSIIGIFVALFILFGGFLVPRFLVPHYWIWVYYLNPLQWGITALVINSFTSGSFSMLCKDVPNILNLPQCIGRPENTIGHAYLARGQFYTGRQWIGIAVVCILGWIILFNTLAYFALAKIRHVVIPQIVERSNPRFKKSGSQRSQRIAAEDVEWAENAVRKLAHTAIPVTLSWHDLTYDIFIPQIQETRSIIQYVSGWAEPGEVLGILGSPGSGKTTLLNCLAGRYVDPARIGGQILVNGYPRVQKTFSQVVGYMESIEAYSAYLTVKEAVAFSAAMKLGKNSNHESRMVFVEEILALMEIKHLQDSLVMSLGSNEVQRDQKVRLAIAVELASNPSILFLDEPTKDLDAHTQIRVISCLRNIAGTGRTIITTLLHTSQRLLSTLTRIQILKTGGATVYFGPVGDHGSFVREYLEAIPGTPVCPPNKNVSTFAIDVIGDGIATRIAVKDYAFEYRVSDLAFNNHINLQRFRRTKTGSELIQTGYSSSYGQMGKEVILRLQRTYWRNVNYSWGRMTFVTVMGLLLGSVYFDAKYRTQVKMNARAFSIFISCVLMGITNAQNVIPQIISHTSVYRRERNANHYSPLLYNIAWSLAEILYLMVAVMIFCAIFLGMSRIAVGDAKSFFQYWFILLEFALAITFLGMFLAAASPAPPIAAVMVPIIIGMWIPTAGAVVPKLSILKPFIWIFWTNPLQYTLNSLTSIAFFCDTYKPECLNGGVNMACLNNPSRCLQCDCARLVDANNTFVWTQLQLNRSLDHGRIKIDMVALACFCVLFRFMAFLALKYRKGLFK